MLIRPIACVVDYVNALNQSLKQLSAESTLTGSQRNWFVTVLLGLLVAGSFNFACFSRRSLGEYKEEGLRWIFHRAIIAWSMILQASISLVLSHYSIKQGVLALDDSDKVRSRNTTKISGVHKVKDKKTGGWFKGQEFVFLILVANNVTLPVGFRFYTPDPAIKEWKEKIKAQKKAGVLPKDRAKRPEPNPAYPSKQTLGLELLATFKTHHPEVSIQSVLADALYGNAHFMDEASKVTACTQVISQLRSNQLIRSYAKNRSLTHYFNRTAGVISKLIIRGGEEKKVTMLCARLIVKSHGKKRFVVALKYENETDYRFIVGTDLTWRAQDIARAYTLRWLVEVFIQDWKRHGGWNTLSKQQGADSAMRGVILSLLCDHLLLLHPFQSARLKNKQPGLSVGCLREHINAEALLESVRHIVEASEPKKALEKFKTALEEALPERQSTKNLAGRDLGRLEPTPSLKYQKAA